MGVECACLECVGGRDRRSNVTVAGAMRREARSRSYEVRFCGLSKSTTPTHPGLPSAVDDGSGSPRSLVTGPWVRR